MHHPPTREVPTGGTPVDGALESGIAAALDRLRRRTGVDLTFSGHIFEKGVVLDRFNGPIRGPLRGAYLENGRGLGGQAAARLRSLAIPDYIGTPVITHHYDQIIRAESLRAMAVAPVVVARRPVAVLYAALRVSQYELGRLYDAVVAEARSLEQELAVNEALTNLHTNRDHETEADRIRQARVGDAHSRLRLLADTVADPWVRDEILQAAALLIENDDQSADSRSVHLTRREQDVLALLAAGFKNKEIAERLGIALYTVKGHVKSLFGKLEAASRMEAVTIARRLGIVP